MILPSFDVYLEGVYKVNKAHLATFFPWQNDFQTHQLIAVYLAFQAILPG